MADFSVQKINSTAKTEITTTNSDFKSVTFTNVHGSETTMVIDLWVTEQYGNSIVDTGINVDEALGYPLGTSSTTVTVGGTVATVDLVGEKVWKSDGTLIGTCTARNSNTEIVFGDGLSQDLDHAVDLWIGKDHYFLNNLHIPGRASLRLDDSDIYFPPDLYKMWIMCDSCGAANTLDITIRR